MARHQFRSSRELQVFPPVSVIWEPLDLDMIPESWSSQLPLISFRTEQLLLDALYDLQQAHKLGPSDRARTLSLWPGDNPRRSPTSWTHLVGGLATLPWLSTLVPDFPRKDNFDKLLCTLRLDSSAVFPSEIPWLKPVEEYIGRFQEHFTQIATDAEGAYASAQLGNVKDLFSAIDHDQGGSFTRSTTQ